MAFLLGCENIHLEYPTKKVLSDITLGIDEGARIGIVGRNGDGKTSLLRVLAGTTAPDSGHVSRRNNLRVGMLGQGDALDSQATVGETIVGDVPTYAWASDARTRDIISELTADIEWDAPIGTLSGGQRRRVDLARVLIGNWDVLMLDEPTNHLDLHAIAWLAEHLRTRWTARAGALLVVTHDRWFLDEVCLQMWEVHDGTVEPFEGGYSAYVLQRVERDEALRRAEAKRRNLMRRELAWLSRGARARATKPKFHVAAARALIADVPPLRNPIELRRSAISRLGKRVVDFENVTMRYGSNTILDNVTWRIGPGDRIGILGANGIGKTTLLKLIQGVLQPTSGTVRIGQTVRFAYLSQQLEELEELGDSRVREVLRRYKTTYEIDGQEVSPSQLLERLGFEPEHLNTPVCDLSGGQKRRLQLMLILLDRPNVLILDEPGNDLDTDMLAEMESLLDTWPGTLLLVTHDRYLTERVTDDQYALIGGRVRHVPRGVDEYLELLEEASSPSQEPAPGTSTDAGSADDEGGKTRAESTKIPRAEEYRLKKKLASTERKLDTLRGKLKEADARLAAADPSDYIALCELQSDKDDILAQVDELELTWLEISELLS